MKLADKLIELRKSKGWSQEDFAEKMDVSRQAISRWENGTALPDAQNILRISKLFNVTSDYLLNDDYEDRTSVAESERRAEAPQKEAAVQLTEKKVFPYWYLIFAICFIILSACIIVKVVRDADLPKEEVHIHSVFRTVKEGESAPTCAKEGAYDEVIYCEECDEEILRTHKTVAKLAHTLTGGVKETSVAPTCSAVGSYDMVLYCTECGEEILRTHKTVAKIAHTLTDSKIESEVASTCLEKGSYDEVVYCSDCGDAVLITHRITDRLEHQFQNDQCILCGEERPSEGLLYISSGSGTCTVARGECTEENIVVPSYSPEGDRVTKIKDYAFAGGIDLKSVKLPETVTFIGMGAFLDCIQLESVNLPSKITVINASTFEGCESLREITIPSRVYLIGESAFADCFSCERLVIPASVSYIGKFALDSLYHCDGNVTFERYNGWKLYDDTGAFYDNVDFENSAHTPTLYITLIYSDYTWKRN